MDSHTRSLRREISITGLEIDTVYSKREDVINKLQWYQRQGPNYNREYQSLKVTYNSLSCQLDKLERSLGRFQCALKNHTERLDDGRDRLRKSKVALPNQQQHYQSLLSNNYHTSYDLYDDHFPTSLHSSSQGVHDIYADATYHNIPVMRKRGR